MVPPAGDAETICIRRSRGHPESCRPEDITPRRLGLLLQDRCIIVEYEVRGRSLLAHHRIAAPRGVAAEELCRQHRVWLRGVAPEQLEGLLARLEDAAPPGEAPSPAQPAAQPSVEPSAQPSAQPSVQVADTDGGKRPAAWAGGYPQRGASELPAALAARVPSPATSRLGEEEARELRQLLFGSAAAKSDSKELPQEWLQGWCFEPEAASCCPYGLRQAEGGPCGVVAPVQALLVRGLLAASAAPSSAAAERCRAALLDAMTDALFRCAGDVGEARVLALQPAANAPAAARRTLRGPWGCVVHAFQDREALRGAWEKPPLSSTYLQKDPERPADSAGVLMFLYSAMATRGVDRVRADADRPEEAQMIGAHGYCTQEAVSLLLTGAARSNVFDGEKVLGGGSGPGEDRLVLRGIEARPEVGFLTMFEAFDSLEVGAFLKNPVWPVWVAHAESHYSLLFAQDPAVTDAEGAAKECDVWYYDPLGRQDEEKRISVRPGALASPPDEDDLDSNGMIAKVIRTRWGKLAELDWNGSEPIY